MPSKSRIGAALLAAAALWTEGQAQAYTCTNLGNTSCNYDCDCDCGYVCQPGPGGGCVVAETHPQVPGLCDVSFPSCACLLGLNITVAQTCVAGICRPTWFELEDAGELFIPDTGVFPPPPACLFDFDCGCGFHCAPNPADGGNQCVAFADSPGGATGGFCYCADNTPGSCISASCGCPGATCACENQNCDDGGAGTCHPDAGPVDAGDAGPVEPPDAGKDCVVDIDCPSGCGTVCSHAMTYWLCIQGSGDQGFCNTDLDCPCIDQFCAYTSSNHCRSRAVDAGVDAGSSSGSGGGSSCGSGGGLTSLGVLGLLGLLATSIPSRRRQLAGRP